MLVEGIRDCMFNFFKKEPIPVVAKYFRTPTMMVAGELSSSQAKWKNAIFPDKKNELMETFKGKFLSSYVEGKLIYNLATMEEVNSAVNSFFRYIPEVVDRWKRPYEFWQDGGGDCEDFAIAKWFFLHKTFPCELLIVKRRKEEDYHAVLLVEYENTQYVLDIITDKILPTTQIDYYIPIYSFDEMHQYFYIQNLSKRGQKC